MVATPPPFSLLGLIVTHEAEPRFRLTFKPAVSADGRQGWESAGQPEWFGGQPAAQPGESAERFALRLARLMREAGDFLAAHVREDWMQQRVIDRAAELALSSYEIAKRTGGAVSEDHVRAYLSRRKSMGSHKLQHVLRVLRLTLRNA